MEKKNAVVLLTRFPHHMWLNFLKSFNNYDIYVAIDDNSQNYSELYHNKNEYMNINFIQYSEEECEKNNFYNLLLPLDTVPDKKVMSWDKAFYYFCKINNSYEHIWFIEDDVFFMSEDILINIDTQFPETDLLTRDNFVAHSKENYVHNYFIKDLEYPLYFSMVCACRISKRLLRLITEYANKYEHLEYHETLFNTLAVKNNLIIHNPKELEKIEYRTIHDIHDIHNISEYIYHPMKNYYLHCYIRDNKIKNFNIIEYKSLNHDIEKLSDEDAIKHYYDYGIFENRLYSYNQFNIEEYKDKKPFLKNSSNEEIIEYYYYHGRYEIKK